MEVRYKWYNSTILIVGLCLTWRFYYFPLVIGVFLLIKQQMVITDMTRICERYPTLLVMEKEVEERKNECDFKIEKIDIEYDMYVDEFKIKKNELNTVIAKLNSEIVNLKNTKKEINQEIDFIENECLIAHYKCSDYIKLSSSGCKNELVILKNKEKEMIRSNNIIVTSYRSKKEINNNKKQIIRCFNSECDNILLNLTYNNIDVSRNKLAKVYETMNKIFEVDGVKLDIAFLKMKLKQLDLVYTYAKKLKEEHEIQKQIKEQMREEKKVEAEIEKQKKKIEKDEKQFNNELSKLISYMQKASNEIEKKIYADKILELEEKLKCLELEKSSVLEREANSLAGYVYIISNIGSFGEDIYKIGMTRRLEPMDRIKELSSASVPFEFDVHAMIFADNAPQLENALHNIYRNHSVNKVNYRKEFYKISIDDIEETVKKNFNNTVKFSKIPVAREYNETLKINNDINVSEYMEKWKL